LTRTGARKRAAAGTYQLGRGKQLLYLNWSQEESSCWNISTGPRKTAALLELEPGRDQLLEHINWAEENSCFTRNRARKRR
jgi:hypothetical protein